MKTNTTTTLIDRLIKLTVTTGVALLHLIHVDSVLAQPTAQKLLAGVVSADGLNGSHWQTDLAVTNHDAAAQTVSICYLSNLTPGAPTCVQSTINAGQTLALDDVVVTAFRLPGSFGALFFNAPNPTFLEIAADTYDIDPVTGGTLGIGISPSRIQQNADLTHLLGPADGTRSRANFARGSLDQPVTFRHVLRNRAGAPLGVVTETLARFTVRQDSLFGLFGIEPENDTYVETVVVTGWNGFTYVTHVDNISNSSSYAPAVLFRAPGGPVLAPGDAFIVTSAYTAGAFGAFWQTDLIAKSEVTDSTATFQLEYVPTGQQNPLYGPLFFNEQFVNDETKHYNNVLGTKLHQTAPSSGALHSLSSPFLVLSRTYTTRGDGGTIGGSLMQQTREDGAYAPGNTVFDNGMATVDLSINGIYDNEDPSKGILRRTNVIVLNTSKAKQNEQLGPISGTITLYDKNGSIVGSPFVFALRDLEHHQYDRLARMIAGGDVINGRLTLHLDPSSTWIQVTALMVATVIDNRSNNFTAKTGFRVRSPGAPLYTATNQIWLRDHDQTLIWGNLPLAGTLEAIFHAGVDSLVGYHTYGCAALPDAEVNSVPEIINNYVKIPMSQQVDFIGDAYEFKPFMFYNWPSGATVDPCNVSDPDQQYVTGINLTVNRNF